MFRKILKGIVSVIIIGLLFYHYMTKIEPSLIKVTKHQFKSQMGNMKGIKIVQFTDTHVGEFFSLAQMQKVVAKINELEPDIVVFTGDLVDHWESFGEQKGLVEVLGDIKAPFGKFAVFGNHDYGSSGYKIYEKFMEHAGFKVLVNEVCQILLEGGEVINIAGLDDALLGKPDVEEVIKQLENGTYNILLMHEPDWISKVPIDCIDLQLSGHTHGGQVRIWGITEKILPKYGTKYSQGLYQISKRTKLYVNTGIGMTKLPIRLGNVPELSFFKID